MFISRAEIWVKSRSCYLAGLGKAALPSHSSQSTHKQLQRLTGGSTSLIRNACLRGEVLVSLSQTWWWGGPYWFFVAPAEEGKRIQPKPGGTTKEGRREC